MRISSTGSLVLLVMSLSGCGIGGKSVTSRNDTAFLIEPVAEVAGYERRTTEDAIALEDAIRAVLAQGNTQGATCDGALSEPAMAQCSERQLLGRFVGKLSGRAGEAINAEATMPAVAYAFEQVSVVERGVQQMLEHQSAEIVTLQADHASGALSSQDYNTRVSAMKQSRIAIAEALELAAMRAAKTRDALEKRRANGQEGLSLHSEAMTQIRARALDLYRALVSS